MPGDPCGESSSPLPGQCHPPGLLGPVPITHHHSTCRWCVLSRTAEIKDFPRKWFCGQTPCKPPNAGNRDQEGLRAERGKVEHVQTPAHVHTAINTAIGKTWLTFISPAACTPLQTYVIQIQYVSIRIPIYTLLWEAYVSSTSHFACVYTWEVFFGS